MSPVLLSFVGHSAVLFSVALLGIFFPSAHTVLVAASFLLEAVLVALADVFFLLEAAPVAFFFLLGAVLVAFCGLHAAGDLVVLVDAFFLLVVTARVPVEWL